MELPLDRYSYQARLLPALITFTPFGLAFGVWSINETALWKLLVAFFTSLGFGALLAQLGRDLGKRKETSLFNEWGGKPTSRLLSHRFSPLNAATLNRYHRKLATLVPDLRIPEPSHEVRNPTAALETYESCALFLRERTRDRKIFPLVFAENVNYGFRRNLWAWKRFGIVFSLMGALNAAVFLMIRANADQHELHFAMVSGAISAVLFLLWVLIVKPPWVRLAAESYAERLVGSLDAVEQHDSPTRR